MSGAGEVWFVLWFVLDRGTDRNVRGPYETSGEATAVRAEMERNPNEERNLWIVSEDS